MISMSQNEVGMIFQFWSLNKVVFHLVLERGNPTVAKNLKHATYIFLTMITILNEHILLCSLFELVLCYPEMNKERKPIEKKGKRERRESDSLYLFK